jgi:GntR family transcriptional regulator
VESQIKDAIFSGELGEDEQLPSVRQLARDLKISVITVTRAYSDLEEAGFIAAMQGKGYFVLPRDPQLAHENALAKVERALSQALQAAEAGGISKEELQEEWELLLKEER